MAHVLLTGGAGFIGSHMLKHLITKGHFVTVLDRLDHSGTLERIKYHKLPETSYRFVYHDLKAPFNSIVRAKIEDPTIILHLAAMSHVDRSIKDPYGCAMDNVMGTINLLEFARSLPELEHFLYFSTDEVFGPAGYGAPGFQEWDRYNSANPYAASKAAAEEFCLAYTNTYKLPVTITHTMNVYGPLQAGEKFIPSTIRKVLDGETVTIHADPTRTRPGTRTYIHVTDVCRAIDFILGKEGLCGGKINIVGEREVDNLVVAKTIASILGKPLKYELVDFHSSRPGHDLRYALDGTLLANLGFTHSYSFVEGVEDTVLWYQDNREWFIHD